MTKPLIRFGPSGNSDSFYAQGYTATVQAFAWLRGLGLNAFEYPFGRGIHLSEETALQIGRSAAQDTIQISAHAPYYINFAQREAQKRENSFQSVLRSARLLQLMGGQRLVVHVGAQSGLAREQAFELCAQGLLEARQRLVEAGLEQVILCPETLGRVWQMGHLAEILAFCQAESSFVPCIDFAHLHALGGGNLQTPADFAAVLDSVESALGIERAQLMHVHFSTVEFDRQGEKRHHTFAESAFGPRFDALGQLFAQRGYTPTIICECRGTMAEDACQMRRIYESFLQAPG